ncbi:MAG: 4-(cytidine 5'-diphospho)-2-C-methyl-D-erythritol kinase, partial [Solirubrobacteraceae bacterium]
AAGMGGGSADAAAMLRLAPRLAPLPKGAAEAIAARLGADVPGQLQPGPSLATGAGEVVWRLRELGPYAVLALPQPFGLSTADVYAEADRLGLTRDGAELTSLRDRLARALPAIPEELVTNDLQRAALSLAGELEDALRTVRDAGADQALVCGSGPTVIGLFWGRDGAARAWRATEGLTARGLEAIVAEPVRDGP